MPCAHNKYPQVRLDTTHVLLERTYSSKYCRIVFSSRRLAEKLSRSWPCLEHGSSWRLERAVLHYFLPISLKDLKCARLQSGGNISFSKAGLSDRNKYSILLPDAPLSEYRNLRRAQYVPSQRQMHLITCYSKQAQLKSSCNMLTSLI